jgi:hypothetical protein
MAAVVYLGLVAMTFVQMPWLAGFERQEFRDMLARIKERLSWS